MNTGNRNFHPVSVEKTVFEGWQAIRLKNEFIEAVVAPDIGGHIMAFNLGPYAYLWVNRNLGSLPLERRSKIV